MLKPLYFYSGQRYLSPPCGIKGKVSVGQCIWGLALETDLGEWGVNSEIPCCCWYSSNHLLYLMMVLFIVDMPNSAKRVVLESVVLGSPL